jgi:hypothetical protein
MYQIYTAEYAECHEDPFDTIGEACAYAMAELPSDDCVYLIGTDLEIDAIVFQSGVYMLTLDEQIARDERIKAKT